MCDHCTTASKWLTSIQDRLDQEGLVSKDLEVVADMVADLEGMHLQSQHAAVGARQHEDCEQNAGMYKAQSFH